MWPGSGLRVCAGQHHGAAVRRGVHRVWFGRLEWSSADKPLTSKTPTVLGARHNACVSTNSLLILISVGGLLQAVGVVLTAWQVVAVLAGRTNKLLLGLSKGLLKVSVVLFPFAGILSAGSLTVDRVGDLSAATGDVDGGARNGHSRGTSASTDGAYKRSTSQAGRRVGSRYRLRRNLRPHGCRYWKLGGSWVSLVKRTEFRRGDRNPEHTGLGNREAGLTADCARSAGRAKGGRCSSDQLPPFGEWRRDPLLLGGAGVWNPVRGSPSGGGIT